MALLLASLGLVQVPFVVASPLITSIVSNPLTGVAIDGYDPVSYFTDPEPLPGRRDFEYIWGGVPWYFATAANRDVFIRAPEVYAPQFGGYCAMSLSRGYLSKGNPRIHLLLGQRLYFFFSIANREAFLLEPDAALAEGEKSWPQLVANLSR